MLELILKSFWIFIPAGISNMSPVIFKWIPFLNYSVDFGYKLKEKPIFGKNKTYRGFLFGILMAIITVYLQKILFREYFFENYGDANIFLLGFLLGFGALFGDLIKSFFKRRIGIEPGKSWVPMDQIDWILGAIIFSSFYIEISLNIAIISLLSFGISHPIINLLGYFLKIKKNKF